MGLDASAQPIEMSFVRCIDKSSEKEREEGCEGNGYMLQNPFCYNL